MNLLILIGNGFDLHHSLPTDYGSFIKWLVKQNLKNVLTNEQGDDDLFVITKENSYVSEMSINPPSMDELVERLLQDHAKKEMTIITTAFKKFKCKLSPNGNFASQIIENIQTRQWVDIEMEYFKQLSIILKNYSQEHPNKANGSNNYNASIDLDTLNRNLTCLTAKLRDYLREVAGNAMANDHFGDIASDPIPSNVIQDKHHLNRLQNDDYDDPENKRYIKPKEVLFLNFNYTTLPNRLHDRFKKFRHINIHGTIHDQNTPPTFGYGDEVGEEYSNMEKTNENRFLTFTKSFAYSQNNNYANLIRFIESDSFCVYIWGHSCGLSDRTLLNMIFEHDNCAAIQPFYWKRPDDTDNFTEMIQNLSRHFKNKQKFRNRLVNKQECRAL
ncbi:MAG: hypothetical protein EAS52_01015 [Parapedobacter sp.]|nr:MAG: hypothetical protein EAS52_01015 [Parapedobacter sp.]